MKGHPSHFALYKPYGYLSQFICIHKKKRLLGELFDFPEGIMAIGRLDEDSEGLILLTTEGKFSEQVRSSGVYKEYYAQVDGVIDQLACERLSKGVEIGFEGIKYQTLPCNARPLENQPDLPARGKKIRDDRHGPTSWVSVVLGEGKNRQVRKMTAAVGYPTLRLVRVRIGPVELGNMLPGEVRALTDEEISALLAQSALKDQ